VGVPAVKHGGPSSVGDTVVVHSLLEMSMWGSIVGVDEVSGLPDKNNGNEETDQADSVESGHERLSLISVTS